MKNYLFGALAGGITLFLTGTLIYVLLFNHPPFMMGEGAEAGFRQAEIIPLLIVMEIIYGLLLTLIFSRWANITTAKTGMTAGALLGLLLGATMGLWFYCLTTLITMGGIVYYALTFAVRFAVAGAVVAWVLGWLKEKNRAMDM